MASDELTNKALELCRAVENEEEFPPAKFALRCLMLVNQIRSLAEAAPQPDTVEPDAVFRIEHGPLSESDGEPEFFEFVSLTPAGVENFPHGTLLYTRPPAKPETSAHDELLAIHRITASIAEVEPSNDTDTLTVRRVKDMAHWINQQPDTVEPDSVLCAFYGAEDYPGLVRKLVAHVKQLQDAAKRNVKPWEDTFPPTLLPSYIKRIEEADAPAQPDTVEPGWITDRMPESESGTWSEPVLALSNIGVVFELSYFNGEHGCWQRTQAFADSGAKSVDGWMPKPPPRQVAPQPATGAVDETKNRITQLEALLARAIEDTDGLWDIEARALLDQEKPGS